MSEENRMKIMQIEAREGLAQIAEAEITLPGPRELLVRTMYSAVSAGTELMSLANSRQPDSTGSRMGYQLSGTVEQVGHELRDSFSPGDLVGCYGGPYVGHASHVVVTKHLCAKLPNGVDPLHASYCGLGAIGLHAFRTAKVSIGETCVVIGLGMLGNLIAQIATAAGCQVITMDRLETRCAAAAKCGLRYVREMGELACKTHGMTGGNYADAVFIALGNCDEQLLKDAVRLCRRMGRIVLVGTTSAPVPRNEMFAQEVELVVPRAAGAGRYDPVYEREAVDYPYAYARWTEQRNLQEHLRQLGLRKISLDPLITSTSRPDMARAVYESIQSDPGANLGVVFDWRSLV